MTPDRRHQLLAASRLGRLVSTGSELPPDAAPSPALFASPPEGRQGDLDPAGHWVSISGNNIHITAGGEIDAGGHPALRQVLAEKAGLPAKGEKSTRPVDRPAIAGNSFPGAAPPPGGRPMTTDATTSLVEPPDGLGVPAGMEFLGMSKRSLPIFRDPAGAVFVRGKKGVQEWSGEPFDPARHVKLPSAGRAAAETAETARRETEAAAAASAARERADAAAKDAASRATEEAEREAAVARERAKAAERIAERTREDEARRTGANHLDFAGSAGDPHAVTDGVPAGRVRISANSVRVRPAYVARLTGRGGRYDFDREFLTPRGKVGRVEVEVGDGVYEVENAENVKGRGGRHYVHVAGGRPRVIEPDEAAALLPESPDAIARRDNLARPATGPAAAAAVRGPKPAVGDVVVRGDAAHVVEAVGRSRHLSRELLEDMDEFGAEATWETDVTLRPVAWRPGDPETDTARRDREAAVRAGRTVAAAESRRRAERFTAAVDAAGGWAAPPAVPANLLSAGTVVAGGERYDDTRIILHPDGHVYRVAYNGRDGDDWSYNNWNGSVVVRAPATPEVVAAAGAMRGGG